MVWTDITRPRYLRKSGRYASDCSDNEWQLVDPYLPKEKRIGRPRTTCMRDVWDAIQYMASTGCQWAMIPNDFPPSSTVQRYFYHWRDNGILHQINRRKMMTGSIFCVRCGLNPLPRKCSLRNWAEHPEWPHFYIPSGDLPEQ